MLIENYCAISCAVYRSRRSLLKEFYFNYCQRRLGFSVNFAQMAAKRCLQNERGSMTCGTTQPLFNIKILLAVFNQFNFNLITFSIFRFTLPFRHRSLLLLEFLKYWWLFWWREMSWAAKIEYYLHKWPWNMGGNFGILCLWI